jgi:hypothetical protein
VKNPMLAGLVRGIIRSLQGQGVDPVALADGDDIAIINAFPEGKTLEIRLEEKMDDAPEKGKPVPSDEDILARWKTEICERAEQIDLLGTTHTTRLSVAGQEQTWQGIWIGFAVGCGMPIEKAANYGSYIGKAFPLEMTEGGK